MTSSRPHLHAIVIGAGLAGSEAAWQLAMRGVPVVLCEMRPLTMTKAHKTGLFAELVCSNSFRGASLNNAVGVLKEELKILNSLIMNSALASCVPAGGALAVDREMFSGIVDRALREHPLVSIENRELQSIPEHSEANPVIVATGPLTTLTLAREIEKLAGANTLSFYDAISPIILFESIDTSKTFFQSRYDKGDGADYINIPLDKEQYQTFVSEIASAQKHEAHAEVESEQLEEDIRPFEGCMPLEDMVIRGPDTLRFGPLKPKGLTDPLTGRQPYAVVQLRQDNREKTLWSIVGAQTRLTQPEQKRIFRLLPGLENAEFVRLGSVHRNTFIDSPKCLRPTLELNNHPGLFMAGQLTGVEGYVESTACGLAAGINAANKVNGKPPLVFPRETALGSLLAYISDSGRKHFQPMNISFGLMPGYGEEESVPAKTANRKESKKEKRLRTAELALDSMKSFAADMLGTDDV